MIALFEEKDPLGRTWGVVLEGRWKGWSVYKHPDHGWVTVRQMKLIDPAEGSPFAAMLGGHIKEQS